MNASLDTNVIIHLYKARFQDVLFNRFEKLVVYEFSRTQELQNHTEPDILDLFDRDVESGKIELVSNENLKNIGMLHIFQSHVNDLRILFDGSDLGEVYAISIAKTLGCISLVTDDIKERGPHYTLMRTPDSDVIPFAFYELLFLDYMEKRIDNEELLSRFSRINDLSNLNWDCSIKLKAFIRRFWSNPYSDSEKEWMQVFCVKHQINPKARLHELRVFLE